MAMRALNSPAKPMDNALNPSDTDQPTANTVNANRGPRRLRQPARGNLHQGVHHKEDADGVAGVDFREAEVAAHRRLGGTDAIALHVVDDRGQAQHHQHDVAHVCGSLGGVGGGRHVWPRKGVAVEGRGMRLPRGKVRYKEKVFFSEPDL